MAKFQLLADHYIGGQILPPGTIVGEGTDWPQITKKGAQMEDVENGIVKPLPPEPPPTTMPLIKTVKTDPHPAMSSKPADPKMAVPKVPGLEPGVPLNDKKA